MGARPGPRRAAQRVGDALAPRGPDGAGDWHDGSVALVHRRLKIIDLSERGDQPLVDPELGLVIAFNGCIYNHHELRAELGRGRLHVSLHFGHRGDPQGLPPLGTQSASSITSIGMFAFAIVEPASGRVVLGRDRLGIKPLYLAEVNGALRFASTLPALLAGGGGIDTEIDPVALHHYLSFHSVVPAPLTILRGVRKLAPATLLTIEPTGARSERRYWSPPSRRDRVAADADWEEMTLRRCERRCDADGRRRSGRRAAVRRPGLEPDRRAARRRGPARARDLLDRLLRRGRQARATSSSTPTSWRRSSAPTHERIEVDPSAAAAGDRLRDRRDERADGLPRLSSRSTSSARRSRAT